MWQPDNMEEDGREEEEEHEGTRLRALLEDMDFRLEEGRRTNDRKATEEAVKGYIKVLEYDTSAIPPVNEGAYNAPLEMVLKTKEEATYKLAQAYSDLRQFDEVRKLLTSSLATTFFSAIPKARTAKVVRSVIDIVSKVPDCIELQVSLCQEIIEWCIAESRNFLRQRIQSRLGSLFLSMGRYTEALSLVTKLLKELKKIDDKQLLVETHLIEARVYAVLRNLPKAKAALTATRTASNAIYIAPLIQADLDLMSGTLHCEEKDYTTAFSYFLEAYGMFDTCNDPRALTCLKYMVLSKVLHGSASDVSAVLSGKLGVKYSGEDLTAMAEVAEAAKQRSLEEFDAAVLRRQKLLEMDPLIKHHLDHLYNQLLESNLAKIIEPFSCVEIEHVADLISLPLPKVERKLGQMILDKKLNGILDQGQGQLLLYEPEPADAIFDDSLAVMHSMGEVVSTLFQRAERDIF